MYHDSDAVFAARVRVTVPPAVLPLTLAQVKAHLRITDTAQDAYLTSLIPVATEIVEQYLGRRLINQTLQAWLDEGIAPEWWDGVRQGMTIGTGVPFVYSLPWLPLSSVSEVAVFRYGQDVAEVVDPGLYRVDSVDPDLWGRVALREGGASWPVPLRNILAVRTTYVVGYGAAASDIPAAITHGLLQVVAYQWQYRGDCNRDADVAKLAGISGLLTPYRVMKV